MRRDCPRWRNCGCVETCQEEDAHRANLGRRVFWPVVITAAVAMMLLGVIALIAKGVG